MKKFVLLLIITLVLSGCNVSVESDEPNNTPSVTPNITPTTSATESPYIDMVSLFPDEEFRDSVVRKLESVCGKRENITRDDLDCITFLSCRNGNIVGISNLCNLERLLIQGDITKGQDELSQLKNLYGVYLLSVTTLEPLSGLQSIRILEISGDISDISVLGTLDNLEELRASLSFFNRIEDVSVLKTLTAKVYLDVNMSSYSWANIRRVNNIYTIYLSGIELEDSETLLELNNISTLRVLVISHPEVDFGILSGLNNIEELFISNSTEIENCDSINGFSNLKELSFDGCERLDIQGIQSIPNLENLYLACSVVKNVDIISELATLKSLNLCACRKYILKDSYAEYTYIEDIDFLKDITNLRFLDISQIEISDIKALKNLTNLEYLSIHFNNIEDISALENLTMLTDLNLQENFIEDITPLSNLTELTKLNISENSILDISALSNLTNLVELDISDNNITDLTPLLSLPNLKILDVSNNPIEDYAVLDQLDLDELHK